MRENIENERVLGRGRGERERVIKGRVGREKGEKNNNKMKTIGNEGRAETKEKCF